VEKGWRKPPRLTFSVYADRWLLEAGQRRGWKPSTILAFENSVRRRRPTFGTMGVGEIRPRDVVEYARKALDDYSAKTVQLHLNVLHDILKTAVAEELIQTNPASGIERPRATRRRWRVLQPTEVPRVAAAFTDERAKAIFLTFVLTGLRRSELVRLQWGDLSLTEGTLRVTVAKSDEGERIIALPGSLVTVLEQRFEASTYKGETDRVFAHPARGSACDMDWFRGQLDKALATAEITDHVRIHDLCDTALTNLAATGASPIVVMATAGHRSMSTTKQYVHLAGVVFRDESAALEARLGFTSNPQAEVEVPETGTERPETALLSEKG
jgi:integrase